MRRRQNDFGRYLEQARREGGSGGRPPEKPIEQMSERELEAEIASLKRMAVAEGRQMLDERRSGGRADVGDFLASQRRNRKRAWK